jgi:hypothetical protein
MLMARVCGAAVGSTGATYLAAAPPLALSLLTAPLLLDASEGGPCTPPLSLLLLLPPPATAPAADGAAVEGPAGEVAALLPAGKVAEPTSWAGCPVRHAVTMCPSVS